MITRHPLRTRPQQQPLDLPGLPRRPVARAVHRADHAARQARQAPQPVRHRFHAHMACILLCLVILVAGLVLHLEILVIGSPTLEGALVAAVERLLDV